MTRAKSRCDRKKRESHNHRNRNVRQLLADRQVVTDRERGEPAPPWRTCCPPARPPGPRCQVLRERDTIDLDLCCCRDAGLLNGLSVGLVDFADWHETTSDLRKLSRTGIG